ncbi:MAG: hypothetical protein COZ75_09920 [Flavobacteriaceae bacterium CG_4_8_14_3_um_filter_34_10]|nr:hypothetical protein [Flavobacteriia bacterium]OIP49753.1 MAG: hypothetical protein AUK33_09785 [Flavobacteriaceae bacterium CG2_30_34_30]PIQ19222.1 MAG: hypothetical protein COW66_02340 [Flavobacteriaceae bacterium CG18_big_fil_WC_8_21_14_2_50_34_36]PIV48543.1 MAG: hypothetical protein COS19_13390 [Flavobacteriaceae bacterium CG02_land_8_20_14_3_00_34_13]PIX08848.1 MAG: hypothetical protein COZ75_09920 [Flavobacteriaceae bacterium CG_4_8_14_3_um_filter_34_10]PJC06166.1 MAG: hypothetical pr
MFKKALFLFIFFFLITQNIDAQCAMCRAVLESEAGGETAKGINNGILYLMVFPYLLVGIIGYFIYKSRKKLKTK